MGEREYDDIKCADCLFDCFYDLAFHTTKGCRIILETENFYISLGADGVIIGDKKGRVEQYAEPGEFFDPSIHFDPTDEDDVPWVDYISTLFVGERLLRVEKCESQYLLEFDDFLLKLVPHDLGADDMPSRQLYRDYVSYFNVIGCQRYLNKKCDCGGSGELLLDFVSDYVVRCEKCGKSTYAEMNAIDAIKAWNAGELHCDLSDIKIE